ncbi:hypothetical protein P154DRAFT_517187 [Amniculicola lignicola CBS 123094]|uniref:Uncharacterized protein n=1 Tax=Amniculicola lignicola CBS 123094 TaxID=1392246 RepID=A0A6A5X3K6_9PLEO|nr:hypothetical protein P154DRAFT_517187 [Amniculicola lignicola CBS 123094]
MTPRAYPMAGWLSSITDQPLKPVTPETLSRQCQYNLRKLANVFEAIDHAAEVWLDLELQDSLKKRVNQSSTNQARSTMKPLVTHNQTKRSIESINEVITSISSLEYFRFWTAAWAYADRQWSTAGATCSSVLPLLQLWSEALPILDSTSHELVNSESDELRSAYSAAVVKVQSFESLAIMWLELDPTFIIPESTAISNLLRAKIQAKNRNSPEVVAEMIRTQAGLTAITFIVTIGASVLSGVAWKLDAPTPGTTHDSDFWTLVQSSVMQLLGLFTAIYPLYKRSSGPPWVWALILTTTGAICSIAAIPMFLYVGSFWSSVVSFFGIAAQAVVILQLSLLAVQASVKPRIKKD